MLTQDAPSPDLQALTSAAAAAATPLFIDGSRGPLFAMHFAPPPGTPCRRNLLVAQSFGEELNRCRAMVAMQARALARSGVGTLVLDAYGTGDSDGEFTDHTWAGWREDVEAGVAWLRGRTGGCDALWGVRVGAMMAAEAALALPGIERLLLWQPVLSGRQFFNQLLRIRVAADIQDPNGIKKTDDLRRVLQEGRRIEVAGYEITRELAEGVEAAALPPAASLQRLEVAWFEVVAQPTQPVGRANQQYLEALGASGARLHAETVTGEPFWQVHERAVAPALVVATARAVEQWA